MKTPMPIKMAGFWVASYLSGAFTNWNLNPGAWSIESRCATSLTAGVFGVICLFVWIIEQDTKSTPPFHHRFPPVCPPCPPPPPPDPPCAA